jgi:RNA polymerase sigma-54 factor
MRFDYSQSLRLGQTMKLAPRMIQSMEILQMPLNELEERIEQELESNATLEIAEAEADRRKLKEQAADSEREARENERPLTVDEGAGTADFERLDSYESANPDAIEDDSHGPPTHAGDFDPGSFSRARLDGERDGKMDAMAAAPARSASLSDQLLDQWRMAEVDDSLREPGVLLLQFIEDDGFLRTPLETIADRAPAGSGITVERLTAALTALQLAMDPPGIAARDIRESLLLQLDAMDRDSAEGQIPPDLRAIARRLITDSLDDLAQNRLPKVVEKSGLAMDQIKAGLEAMKKLSLAPARRLIDESPTPIVPDAIVEYDEEADRYIAYLNDSRLPNLRINKEYAELSRDKAAPKQDREFLKKNLSNAQWLIDAVQQRKHTLLRVIGVVVDAQRDFFDYGPQALKPLPMTQVAGQLGIHVATVSRAVAEKYLQTPRGVVPLRKFFTGGLATDSGEDVSYDAVRAALQEVIGAEDKSKPLSDEALVDELKKRGIEIARRTVAKYRDQLNIPSARLRKTF